jgi:hypothetical protein
VFINTIAWTGNEKHIISASVKLSFERK